MVKLRIEFQSGSVLEGILPDNLAAEFAYAELPVEITLLECSGATERKTAITQIMQVDPVTNDFAQGFILADDYLWGKLIGQLFGSSGLDDYETMLTGLSTATAGTAIYP